MYIDKLYLNDADIQSEYNLWLNWRVLSAPSPQLDYQTIPGRHGNVDLSDALGDVYYNDRSLELGMTYLGDDWYYDYGRFVSEYHGKKMQIKFSNDQNWYWYGRVIIGDYSARSRKVSATATVFPFKLATQQTEVVTEVTAADEANAQTIELVNNRMTVTPKVTVEDSTNGVHLKWGDMTAVVGNGEHYVTGLTLDEGTLNVLTWGDGTVTFTYRQGAL